MVKFMATMPAVETVTHRFIASIVSLRSRWVRTKAASDNVTQGTWIIVAVALAALIVAAIALPASPVHAWLHQLFDSITSISA